MFRQDPTVFLIENFPLPNFVGNIFVYCSPTVYIGEHVHGLYALPSFVDQNVVKITSSDAGPLLLESSGTSESPRVYSEHIITSQNYKITKGNVVCHKTEMCICVKNLKSLVFV